MYGSPVCVQGVSHTCTVILNCLLQYTELKHVRSRSDQATWTPQLEQVCHLFRSTPWGLRNGSGFVLPVIDAEKADDLYLPLAGEYKHLHSLRLTVHPCVRVLTGLLMTRNKTCGPLCVVMNTANIALWLHEHLLTCSHYSTSDIN